MGGGGNAAEKSACRRQDASGPGRPETRPGVEYELVAHGILVMGKLSYLSRVPTSERFVVVETDHNILASQLTLLLLIVWSVCEEIGDHAASLARLSDVQCRQIRR